MSWGGWLTGVSWFETELSRKGYTSSQISDIMREHRRHFNTMSLRGLESRTFSQFLRGENMIDMH